ncbi:hypothetical protein [Pandoraea fibrosis]|uniref:Uncharacterized protein n=1 Tax=Pandoraea fibrosis TaxID=1891094 RepID=A0A5E4R983_9BURK|nr:hypothetical protein [Pandoraea fibrosis]VVD59082.1 hypothetical protein PFI31113_00005 [Pandoraea fibrosis]
MVEGEAFMGGVGWAGIITLSVNFAIFMLADGALDETWHWVAIEVALALLLFVRPALVIFGVMEGHRLCDGINTVKSNAKGRLMGMALGLLGVGWAWVLAR